MDEEKKSLLDKAKKKVDISNKCRLAFLFIAVLGLLFIYFGKKIWEGTGWYDRTEVYLYVFLFVDILLMAAATFVKFFFITRYNKIVKGL